MKIGYSTWGMPKLPIDEALEHLSGLGFDGVEPTVIRGYSTELDTLNAAALGRLFDHHHLARRDDSPGDPPDECVDETGPCLDGVVLGSAGHGARIHPVERRHTKENVKLPCGDHIRPLCPLAHHVHVGSAAGQDEDGQ